MTPSLVAFLWPAPNNQVVDTCMEGKALVLSPMWSLLFPSPSVKVGLRELEGLCSLSWDIESGAKET